MSSLWADLRFALRMMAKAPGHTAVLVLTLALGIGASTTIFSVVNSVILRPLPYQAPEQLARVYTQFPSMGFDKFWVSVPEYFQLAGACRTCESVAAYRPRFAAVTGGDRPVRLDAALATHTLLPLLGVPPMMGRTFTAEEDRSEVPTVIVLGHRAWQRAFGGDPSIIGKKVHLDAVPVTVIGVMPPEFDFPGRVEAWIPWGLDPASDAWGGHNLSVLVRLKPDATVASLQAELRALTTQWAGKQEHSFDGKTHLIAAHPLQTEVVGNLATQLWLLQGAVLFVLLIAVANVANLLLARAEARGREVAVRHALGATRTRLVRQLITESLVMGLIGGAVGVLVAVWALDATVALIPESAPRVAEISLDGTALAFALGATLFSSLLFGLAPILHTRRTDVHHALKEGSQRTTASRSRLQVRRFLVIAEVALAVVLVIGCGLMVRSFVALQRVDLGFEPDRLLTFQVALPERLYGKPAEALGFWQRLQPRLGALPGVTSVTLLSGMPPLRDVVANDLGLPGKTRKDGDPPWNVDHWQVVGDRFVETMGARLVKGRGLAASDTMGTPGVVMINEAFARKYFPGEDPVGKQIQVVPWDETVVPQTVVGVVADIKQSGIDEAAGTEVFFSAGHYADYLKEGPRRFNVAVRTSAAAEALIPAVTRAVAELDPTLPVAAMRTMDDVLWEAVARPRFLTFLLGAFAVLALTLAAIGIYGVMAYTVAQRTHEIGVRMALGARPTEVRRMVLRQAGVLAVAGVVVGLVAALVLRFGLGTSLTALLFGGGMADPLLVGGVAAVVIAAALLATWIPARRATRVEPTVALRSE